MKKLLFVRIYSFSCLLKQTLALLPNSTLYKAGRDLDFLLYCYKSCSFLRGGSWTQTTYTFHNSSIPAPTNHLSWWVAPFAVFTTVSRKLHNEMFTSLRGIKGFPPSSGMLLGFLSVPPVLVRWKRHSSPGKTRGGWIGRSMFSSEILAKRSINNVPFIWFIFLLFLLSLLPSHNHRHPHHHYHYHHHRRPPHHPFPVVSSLACFAFFCFSFPFLDESARSGTSERKLFKSKGFEGL